MGLSSIETSLTKHIRSFLTKNYSTNTLKIFACTVSLLSCLCAGSVLLFPLFTPVLSHRFGYTQFQINIVGSLTSIGMYLPLPVLGYLADCHGPVILSVITLVMFGPAYQYASYIVEQDLNFWLLAITFGFIGCATSALYFTSLLTCAKIYPKSKGLTISAPVTCYGLSSLIGSQILKLKVLQVKVGEEFELDLYKTFKFFSILYLFLGIFNWVSASVVSIERDLLLRKHETSQEDNEERPLLSGSNEDLDSYEDGDDLVANHKSKFMKFLKDISTYILLFSVLLSIGPSEMYITNMGSLVNAISPKSLIPNQVSIHAVFSTLSRLSLGALSDFLVSKYHIARSWLLLFIILLGLLTQFCIANSIFIKDQYYIISALSGFSYGGLFTLYPTVIFSIWGSEIFGSAWGSFMIAPAIGSTSFGMIYGLFYDKSCQISTESLVGSTNCISLVFWINSLAFGFSALLLIIAWKGVWEKRGLPLS
ncbi:putative transporter MCH1 [Wickerhamomyces ciferrii]|uniref:Probable transporter MCH1 n=1 Tax=Wickerhamomyces ciferrii (strain ATCC 14091 / BCRC 22168 / CBS 111 / JCM 3599 / NBRC 0793 / NRRL Y-1031 F-60-10) TaxID=1206466 RepID=K0KMG8_WICCF|nr:putative transporter MCH1 [Wickerhamomyces ciferrii]CCH42569.1 putative transporter MCH1 [Wickerhamomyces ciferrii]